MGEGGRMLWQDVADNAQPPAIGYSNYDVFLESDRGSLVYGHKT
jgi:hypothetical protein